MTIAFVADIIAERKWTVVESPRFKVVAFWNSIYKSAGTPCD